MALLVSTLVDEIGEAWRSYTKHQESVTALTSPIDASVTSLVVDDITVVSKGLHQIDEEIVFVRSVDRTTSTVTLEPWGRGQSGTTAASHSAGAKVTASPTYPRGRIKDVVSEVVQEIFPAIYAVSSTTLTVNAAQVNYSLPVDAYHVYQVQWQPTGPSLSWLNVKRWVQNKTPTAVELEIYSRVQPGSNRVRVFYIKTPPSALAINDDLEAMGYPIAIRDVIILGACARLAVFTENSRVQTYAVEAAARAENVAPGSATALSRYLYQLFRSRLEDEAKNLQFRRPITLHFTR